VGVARSESQREVRRLAAELAQRSLELERERAFGHSVTDATSSLLVLVSAEGTIRPGGVNVAAEQLIGATEDELVGKLFADVFVAAEAKTEAAQLLASEKLDTEWELPCAPRPGERQLLVWTRRPIARFSPPCYLLCGTDVTHWRLQQDELRASRARIVEAADSERKRLERNLHDGAQQRLVALSVTLGLVQTRFATDPESASALLAAAREELAVGLAELRELARGLHPAILSRGLEVALAGVADRSPVPVNIAVEEGERLAEPVVAAAYYVVSEALTNVARYANATAASVSVTREPDQLRVEVVDDGVGGASIGAGSGLEGLRDRVEAIGGRLDLRSPLGEGTSITTLLPLTPRSSD
jgi:signal transduction histidine kinase